jgi:nucleotide-binding universal stress UspA family protein
MKVLVAIEDDMLREDVLATLRWCVRAGKGDHVMVLHVTPSLLPWLPHSPESYPGWADLIRASSQRTEQLLAAGARQLMAWDLEAELLQEAEEPARAILRVARERQADLVIVGARGRKEHGFLIGSVSQKVKALAETDVLVVRRGAPFDRSNFGALLAVESFATKIQADRAEVTLLHALDLPPRTVWNVVTQQEQVDASSLPPPLQERAELALSPALAALRANGVEAATEVRRGSPAEEILDAAARHKADLIVMGARGLTGLRGLMVGSVTQRVVRYGSTSVLVAR